MLLTISNDSVLTKTEADVRQDNALFGELTKLYYSFENYPRKEYKDLQNAIAAVLDKVNVHDHASAYTNKLVMFIEARHALRGLYLDPTQSQILIELRELTKHTNLNFVYNDRIDGMNQFTR